MKKLQEYMNEGWSVQIYGNNRRLICSLYPSHGWAFITGLFLGLVFAFIAFGRKPTVVSSPPVSVPIEPALKVD